MAKKKETKTQTEPQEEKDLPAVRYIRQPYPISAMQADLSKQQIRILVGMMQSIQDGVQKMFERGANENNQLLLFPDMQDDHVNIEFKFSDVTSRPDAYRDVAVIAKKFMYMVLSYEDKEQGEVTLKHFVDEVTYPKRGSKRDKIRFSFTKKQAEAVFNFTMYSRYMLSVAAEAESKHTARIYMLITSARGFDNGSGIFHWYVTYEELRRMLGCDEKVYKDDKDEKGHWVRKRQKLYKHFKADVLRVAESELKQLFDNGKCDCWFEFVELPEDFVGEPQRFDFVVHATPAGKAIGHVKISEGTTAVQPKVESDDDKKMRELLESLTITTSTVKRLMDAMQGRYDILTAKVETLKQEYADRQLHPEKEAIVDFRKWVARSLLNFVKNQNNTAEPAAAREVDAKPVDYAQMMRDGWNNNKE